MIDCKLKIRLGHFILDTDFSIPDKGITVVFGPSGSGKTSLLRAIAGLERSDSGFLKIGNSIWQDGEILYHLTSAQLAMFFKMQVYLII